MRNVCISEIFRNLTAVTYNAVILDDFIFSLSYTFNVKKPLCLFPGKLYNKAVQVFGSVETNSTVRTNCFTFEREIQNDIYHLYAAIFTPLTIEV